MKNQETTICKNLDLNVIFPDISRFSSACDEGRYYETVRISPSPTIISGGQSGIDSVGLKAASFLGLPAFAIMPRDGRREGETIDDYIKRERIVCRKIELASNSYRFRTYANVYFSDLTILFDFVGTSEGSQSTIDACEYFKKPIIVLSDTGNTSKNSINNFLRKHNPHIINIAGNSLSKISENVLTDVFEFLKKVLRKFTFLKAGNEGTVVDVLGENIPVTVAIPGFDVSRNLFGDFFNNYFGVKIDFNKKLVFKESCFNLVVARPREIIRLLGHGIDIGFVGEDLCHEYGCSEKILLRTGLIPNAMVLIKRNANNLDGNLVCSQYPHYAEKLIGKSVSVITGSAEAYLGLGLFDFCVDSYQTGDTASQNGLCVLKKMAENSLVMLGKQRIKSTLFYQKFVEYLADSMSPLTNRP